LKNYEQEDVATLFKDGEWAIIRKLGKPIESGYSDVWISHHCSYYNIPERYHSIALNNKCSRCLKPVPNKLIGLYILYNWEP